MFDLKSGSIVPIFDSNDPVERKGLHMDHITIIESDRPKDVLHTLPLVIG